MTIPMLEERIERALGNLHSLAADSRQESEAALESILGHETPGEADLPVASPGGPGMGDFLISEIASSHRMQESRWNVDYLSIYRWRVEIHKKYAIAFACLIFIILGGPFAARFPQGGVGMVIGTSVLIFFLYWMGLIGGERLAVRGHLDPVIAMWAPNVLLLIPGLLLLPRMARAGATNRSGALEVMRAAVRRWLGRSERGIDAEPVAAGEAG
jgi:hypothetical protein